MSIDSFDGLALAHVPNLQFFVITHRGELILVVVVPADILDDLSVCTIKLD